MFSLAVNYSPSVGEYYGGRAKAFQSLGDLRGAREACVCMLILDPSSSQVRAGLRFCGGSESRLCDPVSACLRRLHVMTRTQQQKKLILSAN